MKLLAHIARQFPQQENIATEALGFLLANSSACRDAFKRLAFPLEEMPPELHYRTQVIDSERTIPDLVGTDSENRERLLVEAKFWAGLTDNQPVNYLARLNRNVPGVLLFVMPESRLVTLLPELLQRCRNHNLTIDELPISKVGAVKYFKVGQNILAAASWNQILDRFKNRSIDVGQTANISDIDQLDSLCKSFDVPKYLPIMHEDLAPAHAYRFLKLKSLVDQVTNALIEKGIANVKGLRATPLSTGYCRYLKLKSWCCSIRFDHEFWITYSETPLWIFTSGYVWRSNKTWKDGSEVSEALASWISSVPPKAFYEQDSNCWLIPLYIPLGIELNNVANSLIQQILDFVDLIPSNRPVDILDPGLPVTEIESGFSDSQG